MSDAADPFHAPEELMRCYLFDLDGTICDIEHRLHYINQEAHWKLHRDGECPPVGSPSRPAFVPQWDAFYAACVGDKPIEPIIRLLSDLARSTAIVFVSGRSDAVRMQTLEWLRLNVPAVRSHTFKLYMRKDGDHRPDHVLKSELLDQILADGYVPILAFDDRNQVVEMWRKRGITCCQVAEGNF